MEAMKMISKKFFTVTNLAVSLIEGLHLVGGVE